MEFTINFDIALAMIKEKALREYPNLTSLELRVIKSRHFKDDNHIEVSFSFNFIKKTETRGSFRTQYENPVYLAGVYSLFKDGRVEVNLSENHA